MIRFAMVAGACLLSCPCSAATLSQAPVAAISLGTTGAGWNFASP